MNIADVLVEFSARLGITKCFSLNGGMAMHINRSLAENSRIEVIFTHHEQAAVCAAEGFSKALDFKVPGLVCVTAGPGVSNSITGLLSSYADSVPILILAGQVKEEDINNYGVRTHGVQEIESHSIVRPAVKEFYRISKDNFWDSLRAIFVGLNTGRKGPIFIEIPLNVQSVEVASAEKNLQDVFKSVEENYQEISELEIRKISETIMNASRIGFYLGNGIRISGADHSTLIEVLELQQIPRFYSWASQDLEDFWHLSNLNCPGSLAPVYSNEYLQEADLVFFLGARLDLATTAFQRKRFGAKAQRVIIDVDPTELGKFEKSDQDLLIQYDLSKGIDFLINLIQKYARPQHDWFKEFSKAKTQYLEIETSKMQSVYFSTRDLAIKASECVPEGTIVLYSSRYAAEGLSRFIRPSGRNRFFCGGGLGAMGQGLSHGIGACKARLDESDPVWILESDGGLWMNVHELATLKAIDPKNTILLIINNGGYASIRNSQERHFGMHSGTGIDDGLVFPNWKLIAESLDINFITLEDPNNFHFERLLKLECLTIVEIKIQSAEKRGPTLKTVMTDEGPITQPLEDINWD